MTFANGLTKRENFQQLLALLPTGVLNIRNPIQHCPGSVKSPEDFQTAGYDGHEMTTIARKPKRL